MIRYNHCMTQQLTHAQILDLPSGKCSKLLTLLKLESIRGDALRHSETILEHGESTPTEKLYARWFAELADKSNRAINELNDNSKEKENK